MNSLDLQFVATSDKNALKALFWPFGALGPPELSLSGETTITVKHQFYFLNLYMNELGKVKFFELSMIGFMGHNRSFLADRVIKELRMIN